MFIATTDVDRGGAGKLSNDLYPPPPPNSDGTVRGVVKLLLVRSGRKGWAPTWSCWGSLSGFRACVLSWVGSAGMRISRPSSSLGVKMGSAPNFIKAPTPTSTFMASSFEINFQFQPAHICFLLVDPVARYTCFKQTLMMRHCVATRPNMACMLFCRPLTAALSRK